MLDFLNISISIFATKRERPDGSHTKVSDIHISPYNYFPPKKMDSPSMLYIQESSSLNTARIARVSTLPEALDALLAIYVEVKCKKEGKDAVMMDLEEALEYYQRAHEVRYYQQIQQSDMVPESLFANFQMKNVKVYNKKNLLDQLVDHLVLSANPEEEGMAMQ